MTAGAHESHSFPHTRREKWLDRFEQITEWPLLVLAIAIIPLVVVAEAYDSTAHKIDLAFVAISVVFALDLGVRTGLANNRLAYLAKNWPDVVVVVVAGFASAATLLPKGNSWFGLFNVARGARALRILRLTRSVSFLAGASRDTVALLERRGLAYVLGAFVVAVFASAGMMALIEDKPGLDGYLDGLYWAIGTTTTVGNTPIPESDKGKALQAFVMFVGLIFVAWFTANIAAFLVEHGGVSESGVSLEEVMDKLKELESEVKELRATQSATQNRET